MSIQQTLQDTGLPVAFGRFKKKQELPFLVYIGEGQDNMPADNTFIYSQPRYQVEFYFAKKDEEKEKAIEQQLLEDGFLYTKSSDIYIESEDIWVIYYNI